jgi:hypothetical protein
VGAKENTLFLSGLSTGMKNPTGKGRHLITLYTGRDSGFLEEGLLIIIINNFKARANWSVPPPGFF